MNHEFTCCNCGRSYEIQVSDPSPSDTPTIQVRRDRVKHVCSHCGHDDRLDGMDLTVKHKLDPPITPVEPPAPKSPSPPPPEPEPVETTVSTPEPAAALTDETEAKKKTDEPEQLEPPSTS